MNAELRLGSITWSFPSSGSFRFRMDLFWPRLVASHIPSSASQVLPMRVRLNIQGGGDPMKVAILVVAVAESCLIGASSFALADTESPKCVACRLL